MNLPILEALRLPETKPLNFTLELQEVDCILCDVKFMVSGGGFMPQVEKDKDGLLKHLLVKHSFVIGDVHLVANLPEYVRYWKDKFKTHPVKAYCSSIKAPVRDTSSPLKLASPDQISSTNNEHEQGVTEIREFSMLSDVNSEDKELRQKLQMDRLEMVLRVHEEENNCKDFHRSCLFCKLEFENHCSLFDHMAFDHNFSVGQPANLVFVNKFLDMLHSKLNNLVCLYCEKIFKNRDVLKEHMRKKGHKKLNPQNKEYDVFYMVNYLEFGRTWEDISRDPVEEEITSGFDVEKDESDEWGSWRDNVGKVICLFCAANYTHNLDLFSHMLQIHGFDFVKLKQDMELTFYQQIKMINYIRRCVHLNTCLGCSLVLESKVKLLEHLSWSNHFTPDPSAWNQSQFLFPTYENDNLLHCLEEDEEGDSVESDDMVVPEPLDPSLESSILHDVAVRKSICKGAF